nr:unnamed protein product [Spirometra erinaceieuropaei]
MIFVARQIQEKCQDMRTHLYSTFVDLTKAFDTVIREGLWKIMQKFGCPERFIQIVRQLHDGMMTRVTDNGAVSEAFAVTNGVTRGCILTPILFSLMFSAMMMDAYRDERPGIRIAYRTDGHLLNQRRMHFQSRVSTTTVHELPLADDCALNTTSPTLTSTPCAPITITTTAAAAAAAATTTTTTTTTTDSSEADTDGFSFPYCLSTFISHIGLVGHLRIHRTETGEPVPGAPAYTHRTRLHCPHTFTNRMGLFGQMHIHESGIDRNTDTPTTPSTSTTPSPTLAPSPCAPSTITASSVADTDTAEIICPNCSRTFASRIGLVGHLRIRRTETGEPVPGAPTYTYHARLSCPHCPRTFRHRMGLFGHMHIHESGIDRNSDTPTTPSTSTTPSHTLAPPVCATTTAASVADTDAADFSCQHCPRTFTSRIGLVGHLRIHRTETGEPVPGEPTYTHQARLNCPHCPRTFRHRMGLFGHMRIHNDLR